MDVGFDDQALQANLGPVFSGQLDGLDNFTFKDLEDYITNDENPINFPDDPIPPPVIFADGRVMDTCPVKGSMQQRSHPACVTDSSQQAFHQVPVVNSLVQHKNAPYCPTQHSLPESPPDSGSEPYSPPDHGQQADPPNYNVKANIVTGMSNLPQHIYMGQAGHVHPPHSSVSPPNSHQSPPIHQQPTSQIPTNTQKTYNGYGCTEPPKLNHPAATAGTQMSPANMAQLNPQLLPSTPNSSLQTTGAQHINKKRKFSDSPNNTVTPGLLHSMGISIPYIKQEPTILPDCVADGEDSYSYDFTPDGMNAFLEGSYQVIKWQPFQPTKWCTLLAQNGNELPAPSFRVDADKGFNFTIPDDAFVCQKKNHFQITVHLGSLGQPKYLKTPEGTVKSLESCFLHFYGVKMESPTQLIKVEQSQSDRSKKPFYPVKVDMIAEQVTKVTVGRLHFSETTTNNMRKKGKPNPDQRYFLLVVSLQAHCDDDAEYTLAAHVSERIIVRASNPGQFESDVDVLWTKGQTPDSVYHAGRVGVNTDRPDEALTVHGNLKLTGHIIQPSDRRAKTNVAELDTKEQLKHIRDIKVYQYAYDNEFAEYTGMSDEERHDTGVIAQEVSRVLPDAVRETGDIILPSGKRLDNFQVVNKDRIYMENVGAVKELCKVTDNLENKIFELEGVNKKLSRNNFSKRDSLKSTSSGKSSLSTCSTISRANSKPDKSTSSCKSLNHHHHHRHHHSSRHCQSHNSSSSGSGSDQDSGVCSNRFIQITVIILVIVMAFCLVVITTLLVMEIATDNNQLQEPVVHIHGSPTILAGPNISEFTTPGIIESTSNRSNDPPGDTLGSCRKPIVPPSCKRNVCKNHCCDEIVNDPGSEKIPTNKERGSDDNTNSVYPGKPADNPPPVIIDWKPHKKKNKTPKGPEYEQIDNQIPQVHVDPPVDSENSFHYRFKRDAAENGSRSVPLLIKEINMTIGPCYCLDTNTDCEQGSGSNFSYSIPISSVFLPVYIIIEFKVTENFQVKMCSEVSRADDFCLEQERTPDGSGYKALPGQSNEWNLPAGFYKRSSYMFRITQTNTHLDDVCRRPHRDLGSTYTEYHLEFHRLPCPDHS